jgi:hypothetical protein
MTDLLLTLEDAFDAVAPALGVRPSLLMRFANEDTHGGRDTGDFPKLMSPYRAEGQFLYAIIRVLRPKFALEIGCGDGGSAVHMLAALEANQYGRLISVDILHRRVGWLIPSHLQGRWDLIVGDAQQIELPKAEFVFEDADHSYASTLNILFRLKQMNPKCIISHDYVYERGVQEAFDEVFGSQVVGMSLGMTEVETGLGCWFNANR